MGFSKLKGHVQHKHSEAQGATVKVHAIVDLEGVALAVEFDHDSTLHLRAR